MCVRQINILGDTDDDDDETLATQYGMDSTALPEYWDDEIFTHMSEAYHAVRTFEELDQLLDCGYIEYHID